MARDVATLAREVSIPYYDAALPGHDQSHARRVRDLALRLADECEDSVDRDVLAAAAWLHDVGRPRERTGAIDDHGEWAADAVPELLDADPNAVTTAQIEAIQHCLRAHSIRASSPEPETIEAQLLYDADKLEATGAVGIVRMACIVGERSGRAGEAYALLDYASGRDDESADVRDVTILREWALERLETLYTEPGRRLGTTRWRFLDDFFTQFATEVGVELER